MCVVAGSAAEMLEHLESVESREPEIEVDEVGGLLRCQSQTFLAVSRDHDRVAVCREPEPVHLRRGLVVLDQEDLDVVIHHCLLLTFANRETA